MSAEKVNGSSSQDEKDVYTTPQYESVQLSRWQRFKDTFKEAETGEIDDADMNEVERGNARAATSPLHRSLKARHLQMIAIGGSIGTGLFVGSGATLASGGPAALIIGFGIIGIMLYVTLQAIGELSVLFPVSGAFAHFNGRFVHLSYGAGIGILYCLQWLVVLPLELVAASITIGFWNSDINPAAWVAIFYVLVFTLNMFGARGYGEGEFVFSIIKVVAVVGFCILGIIINTGGVPGGNGYLGAQYWYDPGAFSNGFKGVCSVFVNAAFSFTGTELAGLAAAETDNPRKTLPTACKQVFWRITLFYMVSLTIVGMLVPSSSKQLLGTSNVDITASPFVIAIKNANIDVLPSIFNVVILIAVVSVGNSAVYGASRTLSALADQGLAPKFFGYVDRMGRPLYAILFTCTIGLLCFLSASDKQEEVFNWLQALTGLSLIFTWGSINLCLIRFRMAMKVQGRSLDELPYRSQVGVWGAWMGFIINVLVLIAQFYVAAWPIGAPEAAGERVSIFFQKYMAAPLLVLIILVHYVWKRPKWVPLSQIDLDTGRRHLDIPALQQELSEEKAYVASRPWWYRTYKFWC